MSFRSYKSINLTPVPAGSNYLLPARMALTVSYIEGYSGSSNSEEVAISVKNGISSEYMMAFN